VSDGWTATVAFDLSGAEPRVDSFMAVAPDATEYVSTETGLGSDRWNAVVADLDRYAASGCNALRAAHRVNLTRMRGQRAIHAAVTTVPPEDC
jgi:hypothetical protein